MTEKNNTHNRTFYDKLINPNYWVTHECNKNNLNFEVHYDYKNKLFKLHELSYGIMLTIDTQHSKDLVFEEFMIAALEELNEIYEKMV